MLRDHRLMLTSKRRGPQLVATISLLLGLKALVACNALLGIEPAEHDEALDAPAKPKDCNWPAAEPKADCAACDEGCSSTCLPAIDACLADDSCRDSLKRYRKCVGKECRDPSGKCEGCVSDNPNTKALIECLKPCGCSIAQVATLCESYCACMQSKCAGSQPGGSFTACVEACDRGNAAGVGKPGAFDKPERPPDWLTYCFWKHCEMAGTITAARHCQHAIGDNMPVNCPEPEDAPQAGLCPFPRGYAPSPCNTNEDCCGVCDMDTLICSGE
jgi:hypothetical protein